MSELFKRVWRIPLVLGVITLFGLLSALLGTGFWYWLAWASMALPLTVIIRNTFFQKK